MATTIHISKRSNLFKLNTDDMILFHRIVSSLTIPNEAAKHNDFASPTLCPISPSGVFDVGYTIDLCKHIKTLDSTIRITFDPCVLEIIRPLSISQDNIRKYSTDKFDERDYQWECINVILNRGRGLIQAPTGAGKSMITYEICRNQLDNGVGSILILVPNIQLVAQLYGDFMEYGCPDYLVQMFSAGSPTLSNAPIIISNRQWIEQNNTSKILKLKEDIKYFETTIGILEKARKNSKVCRKIQRDNSIGFPLSAKALLNNPKLNSNEIKSLSKGKGKKSVRIELTTKYSCEYSMSPSEISSKVRSKLDTANTRLSLVNSTSAVLEGCGAIIVDECQQINSKSKISDFVYNLKTNIKIGMSGTIPTNPEDRWAVIGVFGPIWYDERAHTLQDRGILAACTIEPVVIHHKDWVPYEITNENYKTQHVIESTFIETKEEYLKFLGLFSSVLKGNTIILFVHTAWGERLRDEITRLGKNTVMFIDGRVSLDDREKIRAELESEENAILVGNAACVSAGINIKRINNIILADDGKSLVRVIQTVGRGLRKHETKQSLTIYDIRHSLKYSEKHYIERVPLYMEHYKIDVSSVVPHEIWL